MGNLFRNTPGAKELRELIIMVTPEIIEDENLEIYQSNITPKSSLMKEILAKNNEQSKELEIDLLRNRRLDLAR